MKKYKVIEDDGGGLTLVVFGKNEKVEYIHDCYEVNYGQLRKDLEALKNGADPAKDWDGNCYGMVCQYDLKHKPQELYDAIISYEYGWKIVADNGGIYPDKMGGAAKIEFGVAME